MNISGGQGYPAGALSNFTPHPFVFRYDDVEIEVASMEGLLQSFKFKNADMQVEVCSLIGRYAKRRGSKKNWKVKQTLWFNGKPIPRESEEYQNILDEAYIQMYEQNDGFRRALAASGDATLKHTIGKRKKCDTVLTIREFCRRLTVLRDFGVPEDRVL